MNANAKISLVLNEITEVSEDNATKRCMGESVLTRFITFTLKISMDYYVFYSGNSVFHRESEEEIHYCCCKEPEKLANGCNYYYQMNENTLTIYDDSQKPVKISGLYVGWMKKVIDTVTENIELPTSELVKRISEFEENSADIIVDVKTE